MLRSLLLFSSVAVGVALALWLRLGWIESAETARRCLAGFISPGCLARRLAVTAFVSGSLGIAAVGSAMLALVWKNPFSAWLAAMTGGIALVLYSPETGAAALLVGALRLVRLGSRGRVQPVREGRCGEQDVAQPP